MFWVFYGVAFIGQMKINLNHEVTVKITPYGRKIFKDYFKGLRCDAPKIKKNTLTMPIWELALIFGDCLYMGNTKLPFKSADLEINLKS